MLGDDIGTKVVLGNDVGVAVEAELRLGAGKPYDSFLGVFWGTGVGGGVVLDRKLWRGRGAGGELGHVKVERVGRPAVRLRVDRLHGGLRRARQHGAARP